MARKSETDLSRYDLTRGTLGKYLEKARRSFETIIIDKKVCDSSCPCRISSATTNSGRRITPAPATAAASSEDAALKLPRMRSASRFRGPQVLRGQ
jgi:hypothetical protein